MNFFRRTQKRTLILWTILLSVSILCAQGVRLHVHGFEHSHQNNHHDSIEAFDNGHVHPTSIHLASDISHNDHHGGVVPELDLGMDGFMKKLSVTDLSLALVSLLVLLLAPALIRRIYRTDRIQRTAFLTRYLHSPPLRAPPHC